MFGFTDVVVFDCAILVSILRVDLLIWTTFGFTDVAVVIGVMAVPTQIQETKLEKFEGELQRLAELKQRCDNIAERKYGAWYMGH